MSNLRFHVLIAIVSSVAYAGCAEDAGLSSELTRPSGGYVAEPEGCLPYVNEDYPLLPMPYSRRMETYLPPGSGVQHLALDYEVWPLAHVDRLRLEYRSDPLAQVPDVDIPGACQRTLAIEDLLVQGVNQEVVAVRVHAGDARRTRAAAVYLAVGDRTLTVSVPNELSEAGWFLIFEPHWGGPRIALAPADGVGPSWTFHGLPQGPARVSLVRTPSVGVQTGFGTLHTPEGFAGAWPEYITAWYGANVATSQEDVQLAQLLTDDSTPTYSTLGTESPVVWVGTHAQMIVDAASGATGQLEFSCGIGIRAVVSGSGSVSLAHGGDVHSVAADGEVVLTDNCSAGVWTVDVETHPIIGRSLDLIVSEAP